LRSAVPRECCVVVCACIYAIFLRCSALFYSAKSPAQRRKLLINGFLAASVPLDEAFFELLPSLSSVSDPWSLTDLTAIMSYARFYPDLFHAWFQGQKEQRPVPIPTMVSIAASRSVKDQSREQFVSRVTECLRMVASAVRESRTDHSIIHQCVRMTIGSQHDHALQLSLLDRYVFAKQYILAYSVCAVCNRWAARNHSLQTFS
jgi:hypothetical protein